VSVVRPVGLVLSLAAASLAVSCAAQAPATPELDALLKRFVDEFVSITPGEDPFPATFRRGSDDGPDEERPAHEVKLARPFAIARYEMPQNLYEAVMGKNPSRWKGPRNSVEMVTHQDAVAFCERVTTLLRERKLMAANQKIRLPTEAEWEYCCRAGTTTAYSFGDDVRLLDKHAWHTGNAAGNDPPVGALAPNPWGLYDMHGYLWEFTADGWHADYRDAPTDGSARVAAAGEPRIVLRGGSWKEGAEHLRSTSRRPIRSTFADDSVGFRCVRSSE
jgi:formylglycine-generating enzyme required for sulfatase activity